MTMDDIGTLPAISEATGPPGRRPVRRPPPDSDLIPVERREDIPAFKNEDAERAFWATHDLAGALLEGMQPVPPEGDDWLPPARSESTYARTRPVSVGLDADVLRRLKAVAAKKGKGYQTLLKEFIAERLYEEEKREGLLA
jgi:hypothetical protein